MEVVNVPIADLALDENNARRGDIDELMGSLREFGQHRAVVVQRESNKVLIGNHLVMAATAMGWSEVAVTYVDDDDTTAARRSLADNMVGDRATWDSAQLASLLAELDDVESLPGITDKTLELLLADATTGNETPPLLPIEPKPGESYDYVMVVARNEIDVAWLLSTMGVRKTRSYKSTRVGLSSVIEVADLKAALNEAVRRGEPIA